MNDEAENLPELFVGSIGSDDYAKDLMLEYSQSLLTVASESVFKSDLLKEFPVVKLLLALTKGALNVRDRLFVRKVVRVLSETSDATQEERQKFAEKMDDPEKAQKVGTLLLELIDKVTGEEKAAMIGKVIRACMKEDDLGTAEMLTMCEMIDKAYLNDLRALARKEGEDGPPWDDVNLENVGIKKPMRSEDVNLAIAAAIERVQADIPVIRETRIDKESAEANAKVFESGLTDMGSRLRRILREY